MVALHPQFINDANEKKTLVILPANEFVLLLEELEDIEDVKLFDEAQKNDSSDRILFSDYLKNRKSKSA